MTQPGGNVLRKTTVAAILALVSSTGAASAQSAANVLQAAMNHYAASVQHIDNYRITMEFMGQESSTLLEKQMVDGFPVFLPAEGDATQFQDPFRMMRQVMERARLEGSETVDGEATHRILVDDLEGLDIYPPSAGEDMQISSMTMFLDTDEHLMRRMIMEGTLNRDGSAHPVSFDVHLRDYRTVDGLTTPFRMTLAGQGMLGAMGDGDEAEARQQLQEMERQIASLPAEQREMMEKMMGPQLEQLRNMAQSGAFEMDLVVKSVEVNVQ